MTRSRRRLLALVAALPVLLLGALPASAAPPDKNPFPQDPIEFPAGQVCPFPTSIEEVNGNLAIHTFFDREGNVSRELVTGFSTARVTNEASGDSLTVHTTGSVQIRGIDDTTIAFTLRGRNLLFFFPEDEGGPGLFLAVGRVYEELELPDFIVTRLDQSPRWVDLCSRLD